MFKHTISFQNATRGIWTAVTTQLNLRIHFFVGSLVILAGVYLGVNIAQLQILVFAIALVMLSEMINTSIEFVCDAITMEHNENIKKAKDVSAGAVLITAVFAGLIGLMVFIPQFI